MTTSRAEWILQNLQEVEAERRRRAVDADLQARTVALKQYQQRRFEYTYADLLASPRYGPASRFFLDELYGPKDFAARDAQFARVVPALVRLFPSELVDTVGELAALHALTERLDSTMAAQLPSLPFDAVGYALAWRGTGEPASRERQIALTLSVGRSLDRLTRKPLLRRSLHLMRAPAKAAGLAALQSFLESGFDTFKAMAGADEFLATVGSRERLLASALFGSSDERVLAELP